MKLFTFIILFSLGSVLSAQNFAWTPQSSGVSTSLRDVYFTDNQHGWSVGDGGVILHTADGGETWALQTSGTTERLLAVFFTNADTGWCTGGVNEKTLLRTVDGGATWQDIASENISTYQLYDIAFADKNTGWVISRDSIYRTEDGGDTWVKEDYISEVAGLWHNAIAVTSDTTAYVAGQIKKNSVSYGEVFNRRPFDNPYAWGPSVASDIQRDDKLYAIAFSSPTVGFAGGVNGVLYKLEQIDDNNLSGPWVVNLDLSTETTPFIRSITFSSESRGMFLTTQAVESATAAVIYYTADAGTTWLSYPDTLTNFSGRSLYAPDTDNAWVVGDNGQIYKGVSLPTGVKPLAFEKDIRIYPNPATDIVNVDINTGDRENVSYSLMDMTGRLLQQGVWNTEPSGSKFSLDVSGEVKGMYLLQLRTEKGKSTFRILKH